MATIHYLTASGEPGTIQDATAVTVIDGHPGSAFVKIVGVSHMIVLGSYLDVMGSHVREYQSFVSPFNPLAEKTE